MNSIKREHLKCHKFYHFKSKFIMKNYDTPYENIHIVMVSITHASLIMIQHKINGQIRGSECMKKMLNFPTYVWT